MRIIAGIKAKKKKKSKKKKKKKKKGLKLPGFKAIRDIDKRDLLVQLIQNGIVKKLPQQKLSDFIGEFNYLHSMLDNIKDTPYDPSMALIRQLVTEYIIFPLGSELVRKRFPENIRSFLFYGPPGTGKTMVVRAISYETNSVVFDLSPLNIEGKYTNKKEEEKLVASVMIVAKEYQPSIIYLDECEKVWPAKKKGKKKKKKKADPSNPARIKKALTKWKGKFLDDSTRITIVGCTSEPDEGSKKDFKKFFDKAIYFPFPDYTTRRLMWKTFIEQLGGKLRPDFPLSTLAHISHGYSAGSIRKTCEKVLTAYRKKHVTFIFSLRFRWNKGHSCSRNLQGHSHCALTQCRTNTKSIRSSQITYRKMAREEKNLKLHSKERATMMETLRKRKKRRRNELLIFFLPNF